MEVKEELQALAIAVNDGLSAYVTVHNRIFKGAATFRSVLKNLFGRGVPMNELLAEAESLLPLWSELDRKVASLRSKPDSSCSHEESHYLDRLSRYVEAMKETVAALVTRQKFLSLKSEGHPVALDGHLEREAEYKAAVEKYIEIGDELNALGSKVFN